MFKTVIDDYKEINVLKNARFAKQNNNTLFFLRVEDGKILYSKRIVDPELNDPIFSTKYGVFYSKDNGEFGGSLYRVVGRSYEPAFFGNFKDLIPYEDKVLYIDSCAHMTGSFSYGFMEMNEEELILNPIEDLYGKSFLKSQIIGDDIYILLTDGLYKFDGMLKKIAENKSHDYINDTQIGNFLVYDNKLYVGLCNRIQVTDLKTGEIKYLKE